MLNYRIHSISNEKLNRKFCLLIILLCVFTNMYSQDIHFTQLAQTQFFSNPAFAGIQFGPRILAHYRNEYPMIGSQINSGFNTYYFSYDQYIDKYNSGLGGQIIADKFGDNIYSRYYINANYAYQLKFNEYHALRLGISANFVHQQIDKSRLIFFDQIDPINGFNNLSTTNEQLIDNYSQSYLNLNFGAVYFTNSFYFGASARNLLPKPNFHTVSSKSLQDMTISAQAGGVHWLNKEKKTAIFPYLLYDRQYGYDKLVLNTLYQYEMINFGLGCRHNLKNFESIMFIAGFNFNKLRISYSYDLATNGIKSYSGGSHELGIRILFGGEDNSLHPNEYKNIIFCPDFLKN
jgi:type IX secretion system PorP/SprF family membrane protein